ncbi:TRAP transporter substrate-binding protein DctP [Aromatoleum toluclasticum]|uniref:TRAP transporter substrate-binding protein DctP n=1 Tax=Aromatoleum toluclasticum TaxID=92003 RepID=UPI001D190F93|nr:TRAP transporter substrate-binding protein DctP [Aromatoleum toluclasticum]MCC4116552.1 TRAP transporter substrate-binding protein DctP [Aromatoleum toluclasticum]
MNILMLKRIVAAAMLAVAGVAAAADTIELKMHSQIVESRPEAKYLQQFADDVAARSNGRLKINVFHAGSLGLKDTDLLRIMQAGAVDMAMLYGEYFTRDAPELGVVYVQGAIRTPQQHLQLLPTMRAIYEEGYSKWRIHTVGGVVSPVFNVGVHCKEPINNLSQLKGKKLRVWGSHLVSTFQGLDVAAQVIPQNSMYMALQTGVVDCAYYLSTVAKTVSLQEVAKYEAYLHPWAAVPWMFGVSDKAWSRLPKDLQAVLAEAGEAMWAKTREAAVSPQRESAAIEERKALGITMLQPFPEGDVSAFAAASDKAWADMAKSAGPKGTEYYQRMKEAIAKLTP